MNAMLLEIFVGLDVPKEAAIGRLIGAVLLE
jgi:hypothetical protein